MHKDDNSIKLEQLKTLPAFAQYNDAALTPIAQNSHLLELKQGQEIIAAEHETRHCYLLHGELVVMEHDRQVQTIIAHTDRAAEPIFRLHSAELKATCSSHCTLICIDKNILIGVVDDLGHMPSPGAIVDYIATEIELTDAENALLKEIHHRFSTREIDLPSLPDVATKINHAISDPQSHMSDIARVLQADPVIAARVMQVANSALYGTEQTINTLQEAISRIGLQGIRALVMSVVLHNLFQPSSALLLKYMRALYHHSIYIAALSHAIARRLKTFDAEYAMLAGLIHDIGVIPILIMADQDQNLAENAPLLESAIERLHGYVGGLLLQEWGFAQDLIVAAEEADNWMRNSRAEADYCDIVLVAQLHTGLLRGGRKSMPLVHEVPAFNRLRLNKLEPERVIHILDEAKHNVDQTVQLLRM